MSATVFSIAPGLPFLRTLAEAVLGGRILRGADFAGDPLALAGLTIYVPTRRAARALGMEFARALGGRAAILPAIQPLGDADEAELFGARGEAGLTPTIDPLERRMLLARFVRQWKEGVSAEMAGLAGGETVPPASAADALWLAADLAALLDEAEGEDVSLGGLVALAPDRLADWWQMTTTFLQILNRHWPAVLAERGVADAAAAHDAWLRREAARLAATGSPGPIIVAGSTATAPAATELMRVVANLPDGALVLPGLDRHLEDAGFDAIKLPAAAAGAGAGPGPASGSAPGHPQYGLKRILARMLLPREAVDHFAPADDTPAAAREAFVSDALRPAATTDRWGEGASRHGPDALAGLALAEAADEREEALAVACAMRDALSDPAATVALTTPDRSLARRVVAELGRFGIAANDSAGRPLAATAPGTLMALAAEAAPRPGDPVTLIGLLKHPLLRLGFTAADARRGARGIEMIALRGGTGIADGTRLRGMVGRARTALEAPGARRAPRPVGLIPDADRDLAEVMAARLETALAPLGALRGGAPEEIGRLARCLTETLEALAAGPAGDASGLYATETGAALAAFLAGLVGCPATGFLVAPDELPDVLGALVATETVRPRGGLSGRAFVWGALEARLQHVDVMILGGLNEGTWPGRTVSDAFLSRSMRAAVALDPPERRIGLAAHDIWMALGTPRVVMTRSLRSGGAPAIASRWLQRILTLAGEAGAARLKAEGETYLRHARGLDTEAPRPAARPPEPRPPVALRPTRYSVTEVETLIRDPYAVHARRILRLEPLPALMRHPGAAERGSLFHAILARFVAEAGDPAAPDAEARLLAMAREAFDAEALPPEVEAIWWPRLEALAANYLAWERERDGRVAERIGEAAGEHFFPDLDTTLGGYADRIDRMRDGTVEIIDFKTGAGPSVRQARKLLAPQLPLEGAMARLGAFNATGGAVASVSELLYVRLRERALTTEGLSHVDGRTGAETTGDTLSDEALRKFRGLVAEYRRPERAFASRPRPFLAGDYSGDYDHLARAREWAVGEEDAGEGSGEGGE